MAGKTITLDEEAYEILCRRKRKGQSFSEVVKEVLGPRPRQTARDLLASLQDVKISEETLDRIEEQVQARRQDPPRRIDL